MNERLRTAMVRKGVSAEQLADECEVDPKTVERWLTIGRTPHRRHRWAAARLLAADETYLWPDLLPHRAGRRGEKAQAEVIDVHPDRASVPRETWLRLLEESTEVIEVLVMSGTFFAQLQPRVAPMLTARIEAGVKVRLCFGDPTSEAVAIRDREEGLGGTMGAKIRASLTYYRELTKLDAFELRLHPTTLYTSLFRYDEEMIINPHAYGAPASLNPAIHLRRIDGGTLFDHYHESFGRVWDTAMPWLGAEV